jgi:hypothetical protein
LDVLADGKAPKDEVVGRLNAEKARKTGLIVELDRACLTSRHPICLGTRRHSRLV